MSDDACRDEASALICPVICRLLLKDVWPLHAQPRRVRARAGAPAQGTGEEAQEGREAPHQGVAPLPRKVGVALRPARRLPLAQHVRQNRRGLGTCTPPIIPLSYLTSHLLFVFFSIILQFICYF